MNYEDLMKNAIEVSKKAYTPYSKFNVGACVLTESDKTYCGCNFENASFGLTICAERNAIGSAIADGERKIKAIAIYSPNQDNCTPCGACRQVISEFCDDNTDIIVKIGDNLKVYKITELLPERFTL